VALFNERSHEKISNVKMPKISKKTGIPNESKISCKKVPDVQLEISQMLDIIISKI
jgi:hypothetical protein